MSEPWTAREVDPVGGNGPTAVDILTDRELDVLQGICRGLNNREISVELFVSPNTVKFHVANLLRKLAVRSRTEAAVLATRSGEM